MKSGTYTYSGGNRPISEVDFLDYLNQLVEQAGSQTLLAKNLGISVSYLNDVLRRSKRPGEKLLSALNCDRVILYKKLEP